jgi:CBS domain-containing protein
VAHVDDLLEDALDTMIRAGVARLPVVNRDGPTRLVGMISRDGLANAYRAVRDEEYLRERGGAAPTLPRLLVRLRGVMHASDASEPAAVPSGDGTVKSSESSERTKC